MYQSQLGLFSVIRDFFFLLPYAISGNVDKDGNIPHCGHITLNDTSSNNSVEGVVVFNALMLDLLQLLMVTHQSEDTVVQNFLPGFFWGGVLQTSCHISV